MGSSGQFLREGSVVTALVAQNLVACVRWHWRPQRQLNGGQRSMEQSWDWGGDNP